MNRRGFIVTGLGLMSVPFFKNCRPPTNPTDLLIGKGSPDLSHTQPPLLKTVPQRL